MPGKLFHPRLTFIDMWQTLCNNHPSLASFESVGKTVQGNDVWLFKVGNPNGGAVLYDGCLHGWEDIGAEVEYLYAQWLLESGDTIAQKILAQNYSLFVPVINYDIDERHNTNFVDCQYGTDLNRNFVKNWTLVACADYPNSYHGKAAASEPETKALRSVFQRFKPAYYLNTHYGGGPYLSYFSRVNEATVIARIKELSQPNGFPWSISTTGAGNGFAIGDAYDYGASAWLFEVASPTAPIQTSGNTYGHTAHTLTDIQNYFFPKILPVFIAFSEACAVPTSQFTLTISATSGGTTDPTPNSYVFDSGSIVAVTARATTTGYVFDHWKLDSQIVTDNPINVAVNKDIGLEAVFRFEGSGQVMLLKGAFSNRFAELKELQMDTLKTSSANCLALEFRAESYIANSTLIQQPTQTPIGYRDQVQNIVRMARERGLKLLFYLTPKYVTTGYWNVAGRIIAYEPDQTEFINKWKAIIQELQPDGVSILNEAPDATLAGIPETDLNLQTYKAFALRSIDEYRSVKSDLEIHMTSIPFWDMRTIASNPVPRNNVTYAYHFYYHLSGANRAYEIAYDTAVTEADFIAARVLFEYYIFENPGYVQQAISVGLPLNFIFGAEYREMRNADRFLRDVYAICREKKIESVFQSSYGVESYTTNGGGNYLAGMWKGDMSGLNPVGEVWQKEMPAIHVVQAGFPIWVIPVALISMSVIYIATKKK